MRGTAAHSASCGAGQARLIKDRIGLDQTNSRLDHSTAFFASVGLRSILCQSSRTIDRMSPLTPAINYSFKLIIHYFSIKDRIVSRNKSVLTAEMVIAIFQATQPDSLIIANHDCLTA